MVNSSSPVLDYAAFIDKIPGILNSNVVQNGNELCEIHVLSNTSRTPKQIVRDIQSLFMAQFNREVDHRIISIAQIDFALQAAHINRLIIEEVSLIKRRGLSHFQVTLSSKGQSFVGAGESLTAGVEAFRSVSQATLNAATAALDNTLIFSMLDVRTFDLAGESTVVVCISIKKAGEKSGKFVGSAFVSDDIETAIVKATLCAINRKIFDMR